MKGFKDRVYLFDCSHNDSDVDDYFTRDESFGRFAENGRAYVVDRRDTPRAWVQYLCNDKIRSAVSNTGKGFLFHTTGVTVTKQYELKGNYLPRNVNGERRLLVKLQNREKVCEFFTESENFQCVIRPGYVTFAGDIDCFHIEVVMFVPQQAPCECWNVKMINTGTEKEKVCVYAMQDIPYTDEQESSGHLYSVMQAEIQASVGGVKNIFTANVTDSAFVESYCEQDAFGENTWRFLRETICAEFIVSADKKVEWNVVSTACVNVEEEEQIRLYTDSASCIRELKEIVGMWDKIITDNYCELPDKNMENFLNVWLKNQIYLIYRYDRNSHFIGYRDGLQDAWGYMLLEPKAAKEKLLLCLSYMLEDGRCPRQFSRFDSQHDRKDVSDSPIWAPIALSSYIKETGDFAILEKELPFLDSNEIGTVENHIYRALDYMYHSRGTNGLVLVRDGDWADGLSGMNKYGEDATSVWVTIAAYHAQNLMADIYMALGQDAKAKEMERRSYEYKKIVNEVGWDGNWLTYGFFADGEPVGSSKNYEGKIWLNPQTWGIFTGIIDDEKRIRKITRSVSRYLDTIYGAMVMYPPYVFYGKRCGRLQGQMPGTFLNGAIYNHAASFKVFSDVKRGDYEEAYDTFMRCLPNHEDNSDTRRTSEPFSVGNVYYGPDHPRYGMNLFSWFTATPSWLLHGGFEEILGVKAGFYGLEIAPHVPEDWTGYRVSKMYRGTMYQMEFIHSEGEKGIWIDGKKQSSNIVSSNNPTCNVLIKY